MQGSGEGDPGQQEDMSKSTVENSTAMTIEFLRARLLSERSVSRTARQRADLLAKRVVELEEELKVVTSQRKKAEKAAIEVVAIFKNLGLSDISEAFYSNSDNDEDGMSESRESNYSKEGETSVSSKMENEAEDKLSTSENDVSFPGRSLSWKSTGSKNLNDYGKKNFSRAKRRQNRIVQNDPSSPKNRLGKSCRQIRRKELGDRSDNGVDLSCDGTSVRSEDISNDFERRHDVSNGDSLDDKDRSLSDNLVLESAEKQIEGKMFVAREGDARSEEMDRVLEHQAQLIGLFEEEENAQREWEEKYCKNTIAFVDHVEPNRKLDETKEKSDVEPPDDALSVAGKSEATEAHENNENHFRSILSANMQIDEASSSPEVAKNNLRMCSAESSSPEVANNNLRMCSAESALLLNSYVQITTKEQKAMEEEESKPKSHLASVVAEARKHTSNSCTSIGKVGYSGIQHLRTQHQTSRKLKGVLEALNIAKQSLQQELHKKPQPNNQVLALPAPGDARSYPNPTESSVGSSSLFRLPTEKPYHSPSSLPMGPAFPDYNFDLKASSGFQKGRPKIYSNGVPSASASVDVAGSKMLDDSFFLDSRIRESMLLQPYCTSNLPTSAPTLSPYNYLETMRRPMFERDGLSFHDNQVRPPSMHNAP